MRKLLTIVLLLLPFSLVSADEQTSEYDDEELPYISVEYATDFSQLAQLARTQEKIIVLVISASYCEYCDLLEEEFLKPMLRNADITREVIIRKLDMDSYYTIVDFSGDKTTPRGFARDYKVPLSPTLLFLDSDGDEVAARILGINSLELYGGYLDTAIISGLEKIRTQ